MAHGSRASMLCTLAATSLLAGVVVACSGSDAGTGFGDGPSHGKDGGGGFGDDDDGGGGGGGGGGPGFGDGGGGGGLGDAACAATSSKGQQQPLDIYIMLDQSGSMSESVAGGGDKWTAVTGALNSFVTSPLNGVSVGIQYFGLPPGGSSGGGSCPTSCSSDTDCPGGSCIIGLCVCLGGGGFGNDSCTAADYAKPDVEIAPLPGNASAISTSIGKHKPTTSTPTSAALQGAVDHAKAWATAHPDHVTIALFATDGEPSTCDTNLTNIDTIASTAAAGNPKILTFVIGVGSSLTNLNGIAKAGGTGSAFIVDTTQNVNQQFLDALNKIRGAAVGCQYKIPLPTSGNPDFNKVNVNFTPGGGQATLIPKVNDKSKCPATGDAWYYDDNAKPTQILLCDSTCKRVTSDPHGEVDVLTGCQSVIN